MAHIDDIISDVETKGTTIGSSISEMNQSEFNSSQLSNTHIRKIATHLLDITNSFTEHLNASSTAESNIISLTSDVTSIQNTITTIQSTLVSLQEQIDGLDERLLIVEGV